MPSDTALHTPPISPRRLAKVRPFYWSVRRELWENRSLHIAPLGVAIFMLFGFLLSTHRLPADMRAASGLDLAHQVHQHSMPYHLAASAIILTALLVGVFYCLGALHGERRDRSLLFWKSLPVSDFIIVLSKLSVPMVILPLIAFAVVVAFQIAILVLSTLVLLASGVSATPLWFEVPLFRMWLVMAYGLATLSLWYAPVWGWLLLVSGWARRVPFLWALLPPVILCLVEKIAFNTGHFANLLGYRLIGGYQEAFTDKTGAAASDPVTGALPGLDPAKFLTSPGLWLGLIFAAAFIAAAIWRRRRAEPI